MRFFKDRSALNRLPGGIKEKIKRIDEGWLATHTGTHLNTMGILATQRIKKLILLHPDSGYLPYLSNVVRDGSPETMRGIIRDVTQLARHNAVDVRWVDGPITGMLIADRNKDSAWVRVEVLNPYVNDRLGFLIKRKDSPDVYANLRHSFEQMWAAGKQPE